MNLTLLGLLAMQYVNIPYKWGGNDPLVGLDCSGLTQLPARTLGIFPDEIDRSAQMQYDYLSGHANSRGYRSQLGPDSFLFYGKTRNDIRHVAIALNEHLAIEASNGSRSCHDIYDAIKRDARVQIVPIKPGFVACIRVTYNL